jgi:hypothetical protein
MQTHGRSVRCILAMQARNVIPPVFWYRLYVPQEAHLPLAVCAAG